MSEQKSENFSYFSEDKNKNNDDEEEENRMRFNLKIKIFSSSAENLRRGWFEEEHIFPHSKWDSI